MDEFVKERYELINKRETKRKILMLVLLFIIIVIGNIFWGDPLPHLETVGSYTVYESGWITQKFPLWFSIFLIAGAIGTLWNARYINNCFKPCLDYLFKECDPYKLMEVTQTGIKYGEDKIKKLDKLTLAYFENLYILALNVNREYEEALTYLDEEWKSKRNKRYKNLLLQTKLDMAFLKKDQEEYFQLYNKLPTGYKKNLLYIAQMKRIQGEYQEAVEILKKVKTKTLLHKVQVSYILADCYIKLGLNDEAKECLEYVIENGNVLLFKKEAIQMYQGL